MGGCMDGWTGILHMCVFNSRVLLGAGREGGLPRAPCRRGQLGRMAGYDRGDRMVDPEFVDASGRDLPPATPLTRDRDRVPVCELGLSACGCGGPRLVGRSRQAKLCSIYRLSACLPACLSACLPRVDLNTRTLVVLVFYSLSSPVKNPQIHPIRMPRGIQLNQPICCGFVPLRI